MRSHVRYLLLVFSLCCGLIPVQCASAAILLSEAGEFNYGLTLDPHGPSLIEAVELTTRLQPDWLLVEFDWNAWQPVAQTAYDWQPLDQILHNPSLKDISICLRIFHAPHWALTPSGPDLTATSQLLNTLLERYAGQIHAIELFPRANTRQGWGASPSPQHYLSLLQHVQHTIETHTPGLRIAAGGLLVVPISGPDQINDLEYLQGLYQAGIKESAVALSFQFLNLESDPLQISPDPNAIVLRHIDAIHQVMLQNDDPAGLVWITALSLQPGAPAPTHLAHLSNACAILRSRLYVELLIPAGINTTSSSRHAPVLLLNPSPLSQLFTEELHALITGNRQSSPMAVSSRQKSTYSLSKEEKTDESNPLQSFFSDLFVFSRGWFNHRP